MVGRERLEAWIRRARRLGDRGATAAEYLGTLMVIVALVGGVVATGVGGSIGKKIACVFDSLGGKGCSGEQQAAAGNPDAKFEPTSCETHISAGTDGGKAEVSFLRFGVEAGVEFGFQEKTIQTNEDKNGDGKPDKKVELTFTDTGSLGGNVGAKKPGISVGKQKAKPEIEVGAGVSLSAGDTWTFDSPEQADQFRADLKKYKTLQRATGVPGVNAVTEAASWFGKGPEAEEDRLGERIKEQVGNKSSSTYSVGGNLNGRAGIQFGPEGGPADDPNRRRNNDDDDGDGDGGGDDPADAAPQAGFSVGGEAKGKISQDVSFKQEYNKKGEAGNQSFTWTGKIDGSLNGKAEAGASGPGFEAGGKAEGGIMGARTGAFTMKQDKNGNIIGITMTQTVETGKNGRVEGGAKVGNDKDEDEKRGGGGKGRGNGKGTDIEVISTSLEFKPGELSGDQANALRAQMFAGGGPGGAFTYMFENPAVTKDPGKDDPLGHLIYQKGVTSKMQYSNVENAEETGLEIDAGIAGIGGFYTTSSKDQKLEKAEFLGSPRDGQRSYVPSSYCAK